MSNKNYITKNSQYVESLVSFILDTKPYHSKLTEISEEYQFADAMAVKFSERFTSRAKLSAVWPFEYFSSGDANSRIFQAQRLTKPVFNSPNKNNDAKNPGQHKTFKDEVGDFGLTPSSIGTPSDAELPNSPPIKRDQVFFAYDKKSFDGVGVSDAFVERNGIPFKAEPLLEGHDFFQSHGAFRFQVTQTYTASGKFAPLFTSHNDARLIREATLKTREVALNEDNPNASIKIVRGILTEIRDAVGTVGRDEVREALDKMFTTLNIPDLPTSYTKLINSLLDYGVFSKPEVEVLLQRLKAAASPLFFGKYTDLGFRESGELTYAETDDEFIRIYDFKIDSETAEYEEWTLTAIAEGTEIYRVEGSLTGRVGYITAGDSYVNSKVEFKTESKGIPYYGYVASIKPTNKLVIHPNAKRENWAIIKTNPIAYSRPFFASRRYGNITNLDGVLGQISVLDQTFASQRFYFVCNENGLTFDMTSPDDENFYELVEVGVPFNNGTLAFTINQGTEVLFSPDEKFYVDIINEPAYVEDVDFGYGYDLDSYDDQTTTYEVNNVPLYFGYATRFPNFNIDDLQIQVSEKSIDGRKWRARAIPSDRFITEVEALELPNSAKPDNLKFYYADRFAVEWSDDDFETTNFVSEIFPESTFEVQSEGLSFSIPLADKPYIAARSDDSPGDPDGAVVEGGDMMMFTVRNPPPRMDPIGLSSNKIPRLIMHGDSYYESPVSNWKVQMTSGNSYQVTGNGQTVMSANQGLSFNRLGVHFTIVTGKKGVVSGEEFTFKTFERKPSFLVHGSVSGWQGEAEIGRYFTNGDISFKIEAPKAELFVAPQFDPTATGVLDVKVKRRPNNVWNFGAGTVQLTRIRADHVSANLIFKRSKNGYLITDSETGTVGFVKLDSTFNGKMISVAITDPKVNEFRIQIIAHNFALWTGHNAVVLRPKEDPRWPTTDDFIRLEKTKSSHLKIALTSSSSELSSLLPESIDPRFIDIAATDNANVSVHSPEVNILRGWLPMTQTDYDVSNSIADFSDPTIRNVFRSAATGEIIGEMRPSQQRLNEKVLFEWNSAFLEKYLPLNASANLIVTNTGWNDKIRVDFSETFRALFGSGLSDDQDFRDVINVGVRDEPFFKVVIGDETNGSSPLTDSALINIVDSGFDGFVPGYDNMPYDAEELSQLSSQIDLQSSSDIKALLNRLAEQMLDPAISDEEKTFLVQAAYAERDQIIRDALEVMNTMYDLDDLGHYDADLPAPTYNGFGIPVRGLGIDVHENPKFKAATSITEIITFDAVNLGNGLNTKPFGLGKIDEPPNETFVINISAPGPKDFIGLTFEEYETQLFTRKARTFEINLNVPGEPDVYIWFAEDETPYKVPTLTSISDRRFSFSIPSSSAVKLAVVQPN